MEKEGEGRSGKIVRGIKTNRAAGKRRAEETENEQRGKLGGEDEGNKGKHGKDNGKQKTPAGGKGRGEDAAARTMQAKTAGAREVESEEGCEQRREQKQEMKEEEVNEENKKEETE